MTHSAKSRGQFTPYAAFLAWLWPGLGHVSLGHRRRGLLVMLGVLFLFLSGVLIGGIDAVDRKDDRLWFLAQALCGPIALAVDYVNQTQLKTLPDDWVDRYMQDDPEIISRLGRKSLGRVNEMGTLYSALAGLMNLVAILDALQRTPARSGQRQRRSAAA
ncbi:MAG: DUF6677 family protein [Planctomycetota bacterium]|jgi:hypothetical protein